MSEKKIIGKVEWFDEKKGFGVIHCQKGDNEKVKEYFAHHSEINVKKDVFRALYQDEEVEFIHSYNEERKQEVINKGLSMGTILGRKLKIRNEETSLKSTRRDTGRIDKRLIAELGFGNDRVFSNTFKTEYSDAFIHISIDVSGSMSGDKFDQAMTSSVAVAKACSMIEGIDVKISLRTTTNDYVYGQSLPFILNAYDSRKDSVTKIKSMFWMEIISVLD